MSIKEKSRPRSLVDLFYGDDVQEATAQSVAQITLSSIRANPFQVRNEFSEESLHSLKESIRANGLLQPVVVRPVSADTPGSLVQYELIVGERRFRAHQLLKKETINAIIRPTGNADMRLLAMLENLQRDDLSVLDKALGFQQLMQEKSLKAEQVSDLLNLGHSTGYLYLRIARIDEAQKRIIREQGLDLRATRSFVVGVERIRKVNSKSGLRRLDQILSGVVPFEWGLFDQLQGEFLGARSGAGPSSAKPGTLAEETRLWKLIKKYELKLDSADVLRLEKNEWKVLIAEVKHFLESLGASKVEIKL